MAFTTDKQTLEDLNIFGKPGTASIYALFNHTATKGGGLLLEEMFNYPLSTTGAINNRIGTISYFSSVPFFDFNTELFDIVEQYLQNTDQRTKLDINQENISKKLLNLVAGDANFKFIAQGVSGLINLMQSLSVFVKSLPIPAVHHCLEEQSAIVSLLEEINKEEILTKTDCKKLTYAQIAELDVHFRFKHQQVLKKLLRNIYLLDVYFTIGRIAKERNLVYPEATAEQAPSVVMDGVYHLQLNHPIANTFRLNKEHSIMFLTGANMAGKSTLMKSVGVALYLAHMGFPVPAKSLSFSVMDGIYTTINLPDNLGTGTSHFYAEVLRVKKIAKELGQSKKLFVIIDELFRGTNVKDAFEATVAITGAFSDLQGSAFIISTHVIEAGDVLRNNYGNINFSYLPTRMANNVPVYTYTLEQGITEDRHGMVIIKNEGILDILKNGKKIK